MKVDQNLRAAIRSTCSLTRRCNTPQELADQRSSLDAFIAANKRLWDSRTRKLTKALAKARVADKAVDEAREPFEAAGIGSWDLPRLTIQHKDVFVKAGGKLKTGVIRMNPDAVIAQLAAATPEAGAKILSDLGIRWE